MDLLSPVVWFVVAIGVLVTVHEFGHYWVARRLGVKVLRFSIGFGRPLLRWERGGVEYCIAAIPLGGYVKMLDEAEGEVDPRERHSAFNRQSLAVRTAVVAAGPAFNFAFAVVAYWAMFVVGVPGLVPVVGKVAPDSIAAGAGLEAGDRIVRIGEREPGTWQSAVELIIAERLADRPLELVVEKSAGYEGRVVLPSDRVTVDSLGQGGFFDHLGVRPLRPTLPPIIGEVMADSPSERGGMRTGDQIVSLDGQAIESWDDLVEFVRDHPGRDVTVEVRREGRIERLTVRPDAVEGKDGTSFGRIGAGLRAPPREEIDAFYDRYSAPGRYGPVDALGRAFERTGEMTVLTLRMLWKMVRLEVSVKNLSGPISIAQYAGMSAKRGLAWFLGFLGVVSISLGILNLLPIPLLDGGHLLYYALEALTRRPVSEEIQFLGQRLGIAMLVGLMGLAFYNDLARLFG